jgi:hypothetical protein
MENRLSRVRAAQRIHDVGSRSLTMPQRGLSRSGSRWTPRAASRSSRLGFGSSDDIAGRKTSLRRRLGMQVTVCPRGAASTRQSGLAVRLESCAQRGGLVPVKCQLFACGEPASVRLHPRFL